MVVQLLLVRIEDQFFGLLTLLERFLEIIRQCLYLKVDRVKDLVEIRELDHKLLCLGFSVERSESCDLEALDVTPSALAGVFLVRVFDLIDEIERLLGAFIKCFSFHILSCRCGRSLPLVGWPRFNHSQFSLSV